ncbi:MAG: membrane protein insertase YidC [Candidatus Nanopelagicales bacterium]
MIDSLLAILSPLEYAISAVLVFWHSIFSLVLDPALGVTWALSIVGLVVTVRILIIPLFVKQVKSQRNLQVLQPRMKELQKKYAGDREKLGQEMMKLYKETGTNPLASCFPILLQAPIFFALFRVLQYGISQQQPLGFFKGREELLLQAYEGTIFGVPLWAYFLGTIGTNSPELVASGANFTTVRIMTLILVVFMSATTFLTQRQLMVKNMAADNPMAQQQKILLYVFPIIFAVGGVGFPIGVLIYWSTTNVWSMGQQFWIIRNNPTPGTPAFDAWEKRKKEKLAKKGIVEDSPSQEEQKPEPPKRQQPKKKSRKDRNKKKPQD